MCVSSSLIGWLLPCLYVLAVWPIPRSMASVCTHLYLAYFEYVVIRAFFESPSWSGSSQPASLPASQAGCCHLSQLAASHYLFLSWCLKVHFTPVRPYDGEGEPGRERNVYVKKGRGELLLDTCHVRQAGWLLGELIVWDRVDLNMKF